MEAKYRGITTLGAALLLLLVVIAPLASGTVTSGGVLCNEFTSNDHFGVLTTDCSQADRIALDELSEAGNLGVMGRFNQTNDSISGRFARFDINRENQSIEGFAVWSGGSLFQVLDIVQFLDTTNADWNINGPVFNGTFGSTTVRIHNHITGLMVVTTEKSVRIKLTMSSGINASPVDESMLGDGILDATYMRGSNINAAVTVKQGNIEPAGNRSVFVDLAKGGSMIFRTSSESSADQVKITDRIISGDLPIEYWVLARDEGAIYDVMPYGHFDLAASTIDLKFGEWALKLPSEVKGRMVLIHTDKMSVTFSGGAKEVLTVNGSEPKEAQSLDEVLAAVDSNGTSPVYYQSITNTRTDLALYIPGDDSGGTDGSGSIIPTSSSLPLGWLMVGGVAAVAVVVAGVLLVRRSRKK